ncbi:MAG: phosphoribosylglycinamide formyltransferase [Alphaproteobacteria bacterium]|nr:phosphoribosylglycinamide formyltransferase [Pseudomonadota bacterium]TDI66753.1 MAG: phosphoribosylglycinamide formyltransferase [Alphaproteobacteria bacterium]
MARLRAGVLISGSGTNLGALLDAAAAADYPAEIVLVVSNSGDAQGLERARAAGVPTRVIDHREFPHRAAFDEALSASLGDAGCELVCLAGFMRLLTAGFTETWRDRLINIHPSLLPSFKGLDAQARALAAGVAIAGCTVHFVRPEMDAGPIIVQGAVPVLEGDDAAALAARILEVEHRIYPLALRLMGEGRVSVAGDVVTIAENLPGDVVTIAGDRPAATETLIWPPENRG